VIYAIITFLIIAISIGLTTAWIARILERDEF
jgi:hypothetical protein